MFILKSDEEVHNIETGINVFLGDCCWAPVIAIVYTNFLFTFVRVLTNMS